MEISYLEEGGCIAICNDPIEPGFFVSRVCATPREAFDDLKNTLDRVYYDLK